MEDNWKERISSKCKNKYNEERPLLTIRSDLPPRILKFIRELKRLNKGSQWINEAIQEKFHRDARLESKRKYEEKRKAERKRIREEKENNKYF